LIWLFASTIALLPLSQGLVEFEIAGITFHIYTFAIVVMIPLIIWRMIFNAYEFGYSLLDMLIGILAFVFLQSTLLSDNIIHSGHLAFHALFIPIVSYFFSKAFIATDDEYKLSIKSLLMSLVIFSGATVYNFIKLGQRPYVFDVSPISVATLLVIPVIYILYDEGKWGLFRISFLGLAVAGLVATMSRVYLFMVVVSPLLYILLKSRPILTWISMFIITLILTFLITFKVTPQVNYGHSVEGLTTFQRMYNIRYIQQALSGRVISYRESLRKFEKHYILGEGIQAARYQITPHNFHIEWLRYGGVVGYIIYVLVFLSHIYSISLFVKRDNLLLINNMLLIMIMVNSFTNGFMHGLMPYAAFLLMGLSEARVNMHKSRLLRSARIQGKDNNKIRKAFVRIA